MKWIVLDNTALNDQWGLYIHLLFLPGIFFLVTEDVNVFLETVIAILCCCITEFNSNILGKNFAKRPIHVTLKTSTYGILSKDHQNL